MSDFLQFSVEDGVGRLVFNRPKKRNAFGTEFWQGMVPLFERIDADRAIRVVLIEGAGPAFTAGLDIMQLMGDLPAKPGGPPDGAARQALHRLIVDMQAAITTVERCRVPTIAAIQGPCIGAGVDLITACDIRLCAQDAIFSVRETRLAIVADVGTLQRLPRVVGPGAAREMVFTGADYDAEHALRIGLVSRILADQAELKAAALELAIQIAQNPPLAVQGAKQVLNAATRGQVDQGLEYVATYQAGHLFTQDLATAVTAFLSKSKPEYSGK